ncbi:hypothetical protein FHR32_001452 [Streptosporangium album]|uniref:Outer membrane channel protein CpnT-like N-terminal domain-containing protein n=1 Tax=Streptosporangium album TaxID=47479 RepID=A0A7W7RSM4_9ACTN|nr:hypothetical protein [Streptosporangium album]MBB4937147.1 hypothetical protein [Streptosporangium album]
MGFDGFIVPDWFKPMAGWVVGMDWPEGDESKCFRLADACAATARQVAEGDPASGGRRPGESPDGPADWDGEALKAFAEHVRLVSGDRQAELVDSLVAAALELNGAGVQVEYTKRMIEVSVWFLLLQIVWLARAAFVSGGLTLGLIGARAQLTRLTIRQIATRLLFNIGLFGTLVGGMDLGVQASQSRRDAIDWNQFLTSVGTGALTGVFLTGLSGGLSRLSTSGLQAGLARGEMTAAEKWLATATRSMAGMMAQSGVANGAATAVTLGLSGQFDWEMVLKGTTAGVFGAADAHWAGMTPTGRGPDVGGGPGGGSGPDTGGGPGGHGSAGRVPGHARSDSVTSLAQAVPDRPAVLADASPSTHPDLERGVSDAHDVVLAGGEPASQNPPPRPPDAGGWLGRSVDSGLRHSRTVEGGATRLEIVTFGDGVSAIRFTGRDADAAEAAALVRQTLGLDGPVVHRAGDFVYQDYGNNALRRSVATGIRDFQLIDLEGGDRRELVTFNDGAQAFRREYEKIADADDHELKALPPRTVADADAGIYRASETVVYENRVRWAEHEALRPLVWSEPLTTSVNRSLYDLLTLGESFHRHGAGTDELGQPTLRIGRDFADAWEETLTYHFISLLDRDISSQADLVDLVLGLNALDEADVAAVSARLGALRPEFERRGWLDWYDDLTDRFGFVARNADGDRPALGNLDGLIRHEEADGHTVEHRADPLGWSHGPAAKEPHEALAHVLQGDNLRELNEVAAGRAADSGDIARAQAYAELADAALARQPHGEGTVQARVPADWIPADLVPGRELAFRGLLDGVDDSRFLPDAPRSVQLTIRGEHALIDGVSGKPHHVMFGADSRFKVLAVHESSYGVKNYFLLHIPEGGDVAPLVREGGRAGARSELTGELLRHFEEHREETDAGVWYCDPGHEADMAIAESAYAVPVMDGSFYVDGHGNPDGIFIGDTQLTARELAVLLLNEPRLRPDDVIFLGNCRIGQGEVPFALELARETGHMVVAAESLMEVNEYGDMTPIDSEGGRGFLSERGGLRIFLPDNPIPGGLWERVKSLVAGGWPNPFGHEGGPGIRTRDEPAAALSELPQAQGTVRGYHDVPPRLPQVVPDSPAHAVPDGAPAARPGVDRIDGLINRSDSPDATALAERMGPPTSHRAGADAVEPLRPAVLGDHGKPVESDVPRGVPVAHPDPPIVRADTSSFAYPDADPARGAPGGRDVPAVGDAPVRPDPATSHADHAGGLERSVNTGIRESRVIETVDTRVEIVMFGDGVSAIRFTGRDADAAEAAALVRQALGLKEIPVHRVGDALYQDYGNNALRKSVATGIRRSEPVVNEHGQVQELVTFNDGKKALRVEYNLARHADSHELMALPPRSVGDTDGGLFRASETVVYSDRHSPTTDERLKPLVWREPVADRMTRSLCSVLTLGEGFSWHHVAVDADGVHRLEVDAKFAPAWSKLLLQKFVTPRYSDWTGKLTHFTFNQNVLSPADVAAVSARLEALRPEFERRGWLDWHDGLMDRFDHIARHAEGDQPVLRDLEGRAGSGGDGVRATESAGWRSHDPRAALSGLLVGGDLRQLHDALIGRSGDLGDAARAQAYVDLANADLARLPHREGHVQVRVPLDWIPGDLTPGAEFTFGGLLDGVDDPRFLPDAPRSAQLTIRGVYAPVGDISGKPHHAMFDAGSRFKVLAVQESSSRVKSYFLLQVHEGQQVSPTPSESAGTPARPELTGELLRHFDEHREEIRSGVWYRDPNNRHDMKNADASRAALPVEGAFTVFSHGNPDGIYIGTKRLTAQEAAHLLLNEPGLRPDDVIFLGGCETGRGVAPFAQGVADRTGRVVIAADSLTLVAARGDRFANNWVNAPYALFGRGQFRIFLPDSPVPAHVWDRIHSWADGGQATPLHDADGSEGRPAGGPRTTERPDNAY